MATKRNVGRNWFQLIEEAERFPYPEKHTFDTIVETLGIEGIRPGVYDRGDSLTTH